MNSHLIRPLLLGVFAFPLLLAAQQGAEGRQAPAGAGGQEAQRQALVGQTVVGMGQASAAGTRVGDAGSGAAGVPGQGGTGEGTWYSDPGNNFFSNVPINELSAKAYRRFHRLFREVQTGEYWFKYEQGYQVSFMLDQRHEFAYFDRSGFFLYSLRSYDGKELSKDLTEFVKRRFPDYKIDVVTEVNNGQGTFYMLQIMNPDKIKVLTIADGRIDVVKDLVNGSAKIGPAEAAR
ncbi:MAG TPA: hypothetical protein VG101_10440 [Puia sp.]|jgi:hypothetical protein|nr:hypothetical protein [Puia sp.]